MSRIFDALKKAESSRAHAVPQVSPIAPSAHAGGSSAAASRPQARPGEARALVLPLLGSLPLADDVLREMSTLRVSLESALGDRLPRVIAFLGPQGREGASTVALQFAQTLARDPEVRPLLVDGNVRRPSYEVDSGRRMAVLDPQLLPGSGGDRAVVTANLLVVPAPDELRRTGVYSPTSMREVLDEAANGFDWVVIDAPAVLESPDAAAIAALADGVVIVVQGGRTKRPVLTRSAELVRKAGGRVLGSVLNRRRLEIPEFIYRRI